MVKKSWWFGILLGIVAGGIGLLPWLVTGARLPLQDLGTARSAHEVTFVLLPFSQYDLVPLVGLLVVGAALGGLACRILGARRGWVLVGVLVVQLTAVVQTAVATAHELTERPISAAYLAALVAGSLAAVVLGAIVLGLIGARHRAAVVLGVALAAIPLENWPFPYRGPLVSPPALLTAVFGLLEWLPAVVVGAAIGWAGLNTVGRVLAAVFALLVLWIAPPIVTAVVVTTGSTALLHDPADLVQNAVRIVESAVGMPLPAALHLGLAVVLAAVILAVRALAGRRPRP